MEYVKQYKKIKTFMLFIIYVLFFIELLSMYENLNRCSFEQDIIEMPNYAYNQTNNEYIFEIETNCICEDDLYRLINISGWLIKKDNNLFSPVEADLLLVSDNNIYKLNLHYTKRTDLYYLNQANNNDKNLYVGWFGKCPADNIENGIYKLGFLLQEDNNQSILWTEKTIEIN